MYLRIALALTASVIGLIAPARAADTPRYAGLGVGQAKLHDVCSTPGLTSCEDTHSGYRLYLGSVIRPGLSWEGYYADLGEVEATGPGGAGKAGAWALGAQVLGGTSINSFVAVFGKAGLAYVSGDASVAGLEFDDSDVALSLGLGAHFNLSRNIGLRAEWERHFDALGADIDLLSAGLVFGF
jgi:opacity protein-like surface antigen